MVFIKDLKALPLLRVSPLLQTFIPSMALAEWRSPLGTDIRDFTLKVSALQKELVQKTAGEFGGTIKYPQQSIDALYQTFRAKLKGEPFDMFMLRSSAEHTTACPANELQHPRTPEHPRIIS